MYYVSRQHYYYSQELVVEIAVGGLDYAGPDMLAGNYKGEGEYSDPRKAVEAAIQILEQWEQDDPEVAGIGMGYSHGFTAEFEPTRDFEALRKDAEQEWESLEKCTRCGEIIRGSDWYYIPDFGEEWGKFCSGNCADNMYWDELAERKAERVADSNCAVFGY